MHRRVELPEKAALALLYEGIRFDGLCEWAALEIGEAEAPAQAAGWLERWIQDGLLVASSETGFPIASIE
ncbi:MAG: hypothetical protein ABGX04_15090 [Myxococcales bacterium]